MLGGLLLELPCLPARHHKVESAPSFAQRLGGEHVSLREQPEESIRPYLHVLDDSGRRGIDPCNLSHTLAIAPKHAKTRNIAGDQVEVRSRRDHPRSLQCDGWETYRTCQQQKPQHTFAVGSVHSPAGPVPAMARPDQASPSPPPPWGGGRPARGHRGGYSAGSAKTGSTVLSCIPPRSQSVVRPPGMCPRETSLGSVATDPGRTFR